MSRRRVVVVGGGIIGLACAWRLAQAGCTVTVLDVARESREASWAAAGMLAPHHEADAQGPLWRLGRSSLERWPDFVAALVGDPAAVDFRLAGGLLPLLDGEDPGPGEAKLAFLSAAGVAVRRLTQGELAAEEPALSPRCAGALLIPGGQVNPRLVVQALQQACARLGVEVRYGAGAASISGGTVLLSDGAAVCGDEVLLASGAWTPELARLSGIALAGEPVKGQLLRLAGADGLLRRFIHCHHAYVVPRSGLGVVIGSTMVSTGFDRSQDPAAIARLAAEAAALIPALEHAQVLETWTGLRPRLRGGLPVLERISPTLIVATGHFRNGILLTPITAEIVTGLVMQGHAALDLAAFSRASGESKLST
jgi:glycine oxidase